MELVEFARVAGISKLSQPDQVLHFGWYIHVYRRMPRFHQAAVRSCYSDLHMEPPNLSLLFTRLFERRPRALLKDADGYYLEHSVRQKLDQKHGQHETTIALSQLLKELPGKISDEAEKLFLSEAITCYHNRAFRAAIVMVWNLAYDHLLNWILKDATRISKFQARIAARVGAKKAAGMTITDRESFEDLKESETLDICETAALFSSVNTKKILTIQLTKRNLAAHPSLIVIGAPEAEDTISSLINNVVLVLK